MQYFKGTHWYAIRVRYRHEQIVEKGLTGKNINYLHLTYCEKSRKKKKTELITKIFFPGYMFINIELDTHLHVEILKLFGVVEIIKNSEGPIPIPDSQIENIEKLKDYEGEIFSSQEFAVGMSVKVINGPLSGLTGFVDELNNNLIKLGIDAVPGSVSIHIPPEDLEVIAIR